MQTQETLRPYTLRIPESLLAWFKHKAVDNRRSLNSELLANLESLQKEEKAKHAQTA